MTNWEAVCCNGHKVWTQDGVLNALEQDGGGSIQMHFTDKDYPDSIRCWCGERMAMTIWASHDGDVSRETPTTHTTREQRAKDGYEIWKLLKDIPGIKP